MATVYILVLSVTTVVLSGSTDSCAEQCGPNNTLIGEGFDLSGKKNAYSLCIDSKSNCTNFSVLENLKVLNLSSLQISTINLTNLHNLVTLDLSNNIITNLTHLKFPSKLHNLNLTLNKIKIETNITFPTNLTSLNMSNNNLTINSDVFLLGRLKRLDLRHNRINSVGPIANLTELEELHLSGNNITKLNDRSFTALSSLVVLDLSNNRITNLTGRTFTGLCRLQTLDLSDNLVLTMEIGTFQYMDSLIELKLCGNVMIGGFVRQHNSMLIETGQRLQTIDVTGTNITEIPVILTRSVRNLCVAKNSIATLQRGDLDSYPLLQVLNLSRNAIVTVEDDALGRLEFLTELYLSNNLLKNIPRVLPDTLTLLDADRNKIESLIPGDFTGLSKLKQLILSWNSIRSINEDTFGQLISLQLLDLSGNPIQALSSNVFIGPRRLKSLILTSLHDMQPTQEPLSFPVPESGHLESLNLASSPVLANQLLDDVAALTMFRQLFELNLSNTNLTQIRPDLFTFLPRLKKLNLNGNIINCSNIYWLSKWFNEDEEEDIGLQSLQERKDGRNTRRFNLENSTEPICLFPDHLKGRSLLNLTENDFPEMSFTANIPTEQTIWSSTTEMYSLTSESTTDKVTYLTTVTFDSKYNSDTINQHIASNINNKSVQSNIENITLHKNHNLSPIRRTLTSLPKHNNVIKINKKLLNSSIKDNQSVNITLNKNTSVLVLSNETIRVAGKTDAFSAQPSTGSHPGMFVFLSVLCVLLFASVIMLVSHWTQYRKRKELTRGYVQQQDIEVQSLSSARINDLW